MRTFAALSISILASACGSAPSATAPPAASPPIVTAPPAPPPAPTLATAAPPVTAETQLHAWLDAFNSGDPATFKAFLEQNRPSSVPELDRELQFRKMTGGFDLKKVEPCTATRCTGIAKERDSDQFATFEFEVAADAPHLITKLEMSTVPTPHEFAVPRMTEADAIAALGAALDKDAAADRFSGAMLVARDGKVIFSHAYGFSNRETHTENQPGTQFRIGSMNKMFTAVLVMQLVQAGKIKLDAPLGTYLPDYPNKELAAKVTIHDLLTHAGGTGDIFGPDFDAHRLELKTPADYLKLYGSRAPEFEPGTKRRYSNYGFMLLGAVIEKVTHKSYYDVVRDRVFTPAGMSSTASEPETTKVPGRSVGYTKGEGTTWGPNTDTLPYRGTPAGGGYSTVEDLERFALALENHVLLDAEHTALLVTPKPIAGSHSQYAYGIGNEDLEGLACFGHDGGAPGMNGELSICPKDGYVIVVLSNLDPPAAEREGKWLAARLPLAAP